MERFQSILAIMPITTNRRSALARAVSIAKCHSASLKVVRTIEDPAEAILLHGLELRDAWDYVLDEESRRLKALVEPYQAGSGLEIQTEILVGRPLVEITREVSRQGHDLVLVESPGEALDGRDATLGMQLMRKSPSAVWMVRSSERNPYRRVMAAVDLVPGDDRKMALSVRVAKAAALLASADGGTLEIVNAWNVYGESLLSVRARLSSTQLGRMRKETLSAHRARMDELLARADVGGVRYSLRLVKGEPANVVIHEAEKRETDILVMGTVARSGVAGVLVGNTAEAVAGRVGCSILAIKPEDVVPTSSRQAA